MAYRAMLKERYLPKTLECHVPRICSVSDDRMDELEKRYNESIWNSDVSNYSCSNLSDIEVIIEEDAFFLIVNLKLALIKTNP
jgi:hypothetical protein